jgi:signal transduction histidine kinase
LPDQGTGSLPSALDLLTQPGLGDLLAARDLRRLLEALLARAVAECHAQCGGLYFAGEPPLTIRCGEWSSAGLYQLRSWERAIARRLNRRTMMVSAAPAPTDFRLDSDPLRLLTNAPLLAGARVVGSITLGFGQNVEPPPHFRSLFGQIASNIGGLAYLLDELATTSKKLIQLELFFQVGQSMVSTLDLNELLVHTTGLAASILNAAAASLLLVDEARRELVFEVALGERGVALHLSRLPLNQGIAGWVASHGKPLIVNDVAQDERHAWQFDVQTGFLTRSVICVPLQVKGKTLGVLEVLNKYSGEGFDHEDEELLMTIAGQAAIAIENARLYQSLREERDRTINAQEEARRELARNLHDGPVQLLAAIAMNLDHLERLIRMQPEAALPEMESLRQLTRQATRQARLLLFELRPVILETRGLVPALNAYVEQLSHSESFAIHLEADEFSGRLAARVERIIFAVIQEAVNNIKRHAHANNVWLRLRLEPTQLRVEIEDDGVGFNRKELEARYEERVSFGLLNMRERAKILDGKLSIESLSEGRPRGTLVALCVPVNEDTWEKPTASAALTWSEESEENEQAEEQGEPA